MPEHPQSLHDKVAVVTGGATGIGAATCHLLAAYAVRGVVVNYSRSEADAHATVDQLRLTGVDAIALRADVSRSTEVERLVGQAHDHFGRIDILVNNAATTRHVAFEDLDGVTEQDWTNTYALNVVGAFNCARAAAPALRQTHGAVVNIASVAGHRASGTSIPYAVSKAALIHLTRCLARALAPDVRVNCVSPGAVASRWIRRHVGEHAAEQHDREASLIPLGRVAIPDDVAQAVLGLVTSDYITGHDLIVDGGRRSLY